MSLGCECTIDNQARQNLVTGNHPDRYQKEIGDIIRCPRREWCSESAIMGLLS
jgi:hypothetical protein